MEASKAGHDTLATVLSYWWVVWLFGGAVLAFIGKAWDCGTSSARRALRVRHERRLEVERIRAKYARPAPSLRPSPGPCQHLRVSQVRDRGDELVAWLCLNEGCGKQLPAGWAVAAEDLP